MTLLTILYLRRKKYRASAVLIIVWSRVFASLSGGHEDNSMLGLIYISVSIQVRLNCGKLFRA